MDTSTVDAVQRTTQTIGGNNLPKVKCFNPKCKAQIKPGAEEGLCSDCFNNKYYKKCLNCKGGRINKTARDTHLCYRCTPVVWVEYVDSKGFTKKKQEKKPNIIHKKLSKNISTWVDADVDVNELVLIVPKDDKDEL